jgi:outer membrane biosynthesis protein TonB
VFAPLWIVFVALALLATIVLRSEPLKAPANIAGQPAHLSAPGQASSEAPAANQAAQTQRTVSASQPAPVKAAQPAAPQAPSNPCRTGGPGPTMHPMCVTGGQVRIGG